MWIRMLRSLLFGALLVLVVTDAKPQIHDPGILEFTSQSYNLSISEKWTVNATAWSDSPERIGVYVPIGYNVVKFKIVKGDKEQIFQTVAKRVGDFAFLTICIKPDQILNRELQDEFVFVIKATTRRKNDATHEAQATVYLRVVDDNDLFPFFKESEYAVTIDEQFPVNGQIVQLEGVDADIGLNGQIYYSLLTPSNLFYVEPLSGWVRSFAKLNAGTYTLTCQVEDRASRLFYNQRDTSSPFFRNQVPLTITVTPAENRPPKLSAQPIPLKFYTIQEQPAALLTVSGDTPNVNVELSSEVQARGDTFLRRQSSNSFLLSMARVTNTSPGPISLIVRDLSQPNGTFTAENIPLEMNATDRKVWFNGTTEEDTPRIRIQVNESAPVDHLIYTFNAMTTYADDQRHIKYRIHGKETHKLPFHIDKITGQLRVKSKMSYTQKSLYEISIVAKLEGVEEKAFIDVFLEVLSANNNCPQFKNLPDGFQLKLTSNKPNAEIYKVTAEDADTGLNAQLSYKLIGMNGSDAYFAVDPLTGSLKVTKELPGDHHRWLVKLMVIDAGRPLPQFATTLLQIVHGNTHPAKLTPIEALFDTCSMKNENSPKFLDGKTTFEVDENAPIGHIVGKVQATDKDQGYNGFVQYTTTDSYFGVDLITGEVFIQRSLELLFEDHKKDHLLHEIEVTAHDQAAENPKSTSTKVQIRINDVNNNAPEFEKFSYTVRVTENAIPSEEILRLKATDRDSGVNGRIEYRLAVDTDIIFVDPDSGAVRLEKALDREQKDKHQFLLLAVDRGRPPKFSFVNLTLLVEDSNNNAPNCGKPLHLAEVPEDSPNGQLVLCMAAHDADQGLNAQLQYEMLDASFRIDRQTGCIFTNLTKPMDYELQNSYGFNVTVMDSGTPQLSTSCSVEVKLVKINKNQHQPRFTETVYEASIEENRPKHTELLTVKATDLDGTAVFYDLIEGDGLGYFELDRNSGLLRTATVIDYERNAEFWLTVRATDQDEKNPLSSYAHIYIKVIDLNDQKPLFSQPIYFPTVVENSEPNKVILRLNATDGDASTQSKMTSSIKFSIERGNAQSNFVLDENTGYLVTGKRPLDREAQSEHELYIQACDQGRECSTVLVVVTVLDQNDNKPTFKSNSFNLTVPANQAGFLTRVFASDADEDGPNSDLTYSLSDNTNSEITIDKFGRLFATEPLAPGTSIELTVVAEDNGEPRLRSTALVRLTAIAPVSKSAKSNQPPSFQNLAHWHHLYASDNDNVETILGRIDATDPDGDQLWYRIADESTNPNETFAFQSSSSGELVLARRAELIGSHLRKIELTVAVTDGFAEIRDKVFIHVTRSSLSRPRFEQNVAGVEISEDLPVGYVLYAAKAHFDQSNTGISHPHPLSYAISYVTDVLAADSLRVDSSNGNLILEKPLNEAVANNFSVVISAKIGGGQENFALVNLHKKNFNRHAPKFLFDTYRFKLDPASSQIGTVFAYDIDSGENGQVTYSVLSGNEGGYFSLDQTSGQLTLQNSSNDMPADFTLTVRAVDSSKTSPLSSTCTVYLKHQIDGELDKKPVFKTADSLIVLDEQTKSQQAITTLSAASDSFIAYSTDCEVLNVHFGSGLVQMKQELGDASFGQHFNCTFLAINTLNNQTSGLPVQIKTIRRDNAQIRFERDEYESAIKEQASQKSPLFTDTSFSHPMVLHAQMINSQSSQSQAIRYRLLSPQETFFTVDSTSGALKVAEPIDFEMYKHWTLQAIAHDTSPSNPKVSQPVEVQIQVVSSKRPLKFVNNPFEMELLLPTAKGTFVGQLRATSANNATLRYGLRSSSKFQSIFQTDAETGQLRVATNDTKSIEEREYKLDVQVSDRTNVAQGKVLIKAVSTDKLLHRSGSLKLAKQQYAIHVTENQTVNVQRPVLAIDWPLNANTGESFDFQLTTNTNNQLFLDSRNGLLYMNASSPIDRELTPKFDIAVLITSHQSSQRYAQAIVQINVNDINDCEPRFDQPEYTILLPQDAKVADKLLQTKATDLDLGANGIVRYSLANDAPNFVEINLNDGRILMKSQEKQLEIGRIYEFHVVASDQGAKPLSSRVKVQMKVVDRNQPIFDQATYNIKVPESAALETHLLQIQAKSNTDGELVYQIVDGDLLRQFEIGFRDGRLLINSPLDRERQEKYQLKVQVLDLSRQNVSATTTVNIQIEDVNDSPPRFEQDIYKYSVSESAPVGTLIGQISAVDPDLTPKDNQITYQLVNDKKSILSIDQTTGEIHLSNAIDFERDQFLEFTVLARDSDGLSGEAIIQLNIIDANDNPAVFVDKSPLRLNIQSTNRIKEPRFLHEFKATDLDTVSSLSDGNKFLYSIVDGDETLFQLDTQNGILSQIRNFDANELATFVDGSSVEKQLNISLSDGLFSSQLQVTIVFKPTAGQIAPLQFNSLINAVSLDENLLINNRTVIDVLKVHGGRRPYLFSTPPTNGSWPFFVHPTNGNVFLARKLDHERLSRFVVPFTVQDANQQLAFMLTEINVQQGHDNAPRFVTLDDNGYKLYVSITANEGDRVGMIMAEDQDEDDVLEFAMVDFEEDSLLNPNKYFALDSTTGYLSVQAPIPANLVGQEIEFAVKVIDQGNPPHQHKVPFQLHITDAPVPQFSRLHFYFAISEESESGTLVGQLTTNEQTAKDVRFEMKDSEDLSAFALDKANGRLTLRQKLDRETKEQHQFVVSIQNSQGFVSYCFVTITVIDANDNSPIFVTQIDRVFVREDVRSGSVVSVFYATDLDQGANGRVQYELANNEDMFRIDRDYGWLFVGSNPLDREQRAVYNLTVVARDEGNLSTEWPFKLIVRDVNDNPPVFEKSAYELKLKQEKCQVGQKLLRLNVNDVDTSEVQTLSVTLVGNEHDGMLKLNGNDLILNSMPSTNASFNTTFKLIAFDGVHSTAASLHLQWTATKHDFCSKKEQAIKIPSNRAPNSTILLLNNDNRPALIHHLLEGEKLPFEIVNNSELVIKDGFYKLEKYELRIKSIQNWNNVEQICVHRYNVTIQESNRMAPHFDVRNFTVHVPENSNASDEKLHFIVRLPATDEDFGRFGQLSFELQAEESSKDANIYFVVHESTGAVLLKKPLDREAHEKFDLRIKVKDGGNLSDTANLTVIIDDTNDNPPQFTQAVYHLNVLENEAVGYVLLQLTAHDNDFASQKLTYALEDKKAREFVELNKETGVLRLIQTFDFEQVQAMTFEVIVRDNGEPPLESKAVIELKVLDINDNSPRFEQTMYEGTVLENQPIGAKILKVSAKDLDSEHFGKVSYSLSGEDAEFLAVTDDGWVELAKPIDYESKKLIRANLKALDGGQPALSDEALLSITIQDVNEHPPQFSDCHMNAVVQEGVQAGQSLLTVQLTDKDSPQNGPPFRLEIRGNGASAFTFDPMLNLITTRQLSYAQQKVFNLNVTAFDARGLSQTCPLTILVKQQSLHPPEVKPLLITLNALYGEFLVNGKLGKIRAIDRDQADLLRYSIIEAVNHAPSSLSFDHSKLQSTSIHVDAATGELSAITEMLPGLHRFNISVTDGKFVVHTPITIDVSNIDQDALDHSISLQLSGLTAERFVKDHMEKFIGILSRLLSVPLTYVRILSVQDVDKSVRLRRGLQPTPTVIAQAPQISNSEIEVLLTVSRGESRGFHRPSFVKQRISEGIATLTAETGLEISSLTTEICRSDTCSKGECRDRLWLDNVDLLRIEDEKNGNYYMYPKFLRTYQCICNEGYGGAKCDVAVNQCSREMCTKYEMCIPSSSEANGFACSCAPGLKGDRCAAPTCEKPAECSQKESISLLGNGYFQLFVAQNLEARMELLVEFKTVSRNAYLMHGAGHVDFHSILIENGYVEYRWNCGTGMGQVKIPHIRVDDGQWHTLKIMRRGRQVKLMLDSHQAEGASPPGSDVVNLYSQATILTFGAQLLTSAEQTNNQSNWLHHRQHYYGQRQTASELANQVENGTIGCFRRIGLDGTELPKMEQGLRLFNARIGCDTQTMGVCLNAPCQNNGQCVPKSEPNAYSCICSERYTGSNCEIDLNACADSPCPPSVACHNLYNDFHCQCPPSFTGKTCQMRDDWDPCVTNPCGQFGQCIRYKSSFICNCSTGFGGQFCMDRVPKMSSDNWSLQSPELYILFGIFLAAFLCALLAIIACRRQNRSAVGGKSPSRADNDSGRLPSTDDPTNALIPQTPRINPPIYQNTVERVLVPPPIPPKNAVRVPRSNNHTLLSSGLPTQEVRPLQVTQRLNGHVCCPTPPQSSKGSFSSAKMSFMKGQNHYDETYEETPKPVPPPHRFLIENDESSKLLARGVIVKNPLKKEKVASNPTTSMSSLDNASSSGDYLTMKPVKKKKDKTKQSNGTVENGVHNEEENTGDQHS